jgi:hypothetical protein
MSLNCSDEHSAPIQEPRKSHVMPHASIAEAASMLQRRGSAFIGGNGVLEVGRRSFSGYRSLKRDNERQNLRTEGRRVTGGKLFHREERPTLERNIIDTSERARASYRYMIGQHFGLVNLYERGRRTCNSLQSNLNVCVSGRLSGRSVMICERERPVSQGH